MCQPACRGGNKRSRNTSNPTLICPYRSTMVSPSCFYPSTTHTSHFFFSLFSRVCDTLNSDFTRVAFFVCLFVSLQIPASLVMKVCSTFSENLLRISLNSLYFTLQKNLELHLYFSRTPNPQLSVFYARDQKKEK